MKKKIVIVLSVILICLIGVIVWYNTPLGLTDLAPDEVMEIVVFNGNSGETTHISSRKHHFLIFTAKNPVFFKNLLLFLQFPSRFYRWNLRECSLLRRTSGKYWSFCRLPYRDLRRNCSPLPHDPPAWHPFS